jgi:hypothetical protein
MIEMLPIEAITIADRTFSDPIIAIVGVEEAMPISNNSIVHRSRLNRGSISS